ncbi:MAG: hypothetical protein ACR2H1_15225 [Limisphaerales bacterium]
MKKILVLFLGAELFLGAFFFLNREPGRDTKRSDFKTANSTNWKKRRSESVAAEKSETVSVSLANLFAARPENDTKFSEAFMKLKVFLVAHPETISDLLLGVPEVGAGSRKYSTSF